MRKEKSKENMIEKKKTGKRIGITGILAILILLIIIFLVVKLAIWNSGNVVLEEVEEGSFDYENLDIVFNVDEKYLEGRYEDGIERVLIIGDQVTTAKVDGLSIVDILRENENMPVTTLTCENASVVDVNNAYLTNDVTPWQAMNLFDTVKALCTKDYSLQEEALNEGLTISEEYPKFVSQLKCVDLEEYDTVLIFYSSVDYIKLSNLYNPEDDYDTSTYEGALRASVKTLQASYPHLRIVLCSPYLHNVLTNEGEVKSAALLNYGNGNLSEYVMREYNLAMECCISFMDNYFGLITETNIDEYATWNYINKDAVMLIGNHVKEYMLREY